MVGGGDEPVDGAAAAAAATAGGGGGEVGVGVQEETAARSDGSNNDSSDDGNSNHHHDGDDDDDDDEGTINANVTGSDDAANTKNATAAAKGRPQKPGKAQGGKSSAATKEAGGGGGAGAAGKEKEAAAAGGEASSASVVQTLELGKVVPALIKQGAVFFMGTWLSKKLSPAVEGQVRAARVIYTAYLVFSQALCMYLRCASCVVSVCVCVWGVVRIEWVYLVWDLGLDYRIATNTMVILE